MHRSNIYITTILFLALSILGISIQPTRAFPVDADESDDTNANILRLPDDVIKKLVLDLSPRQRAIFLASHPSLNSVQDATGVRHTHTMRRLLNRVSDVCSDDLVSLLFDVDFARSLQESNENDTEALVYFTIDTTRNSMNCYSLIFKNIHLFPHISSVQIKDIYGNGTQRDILNFIDEMGEALKRSRVRNVEIRFPAVKHLHIRAMRPEVDRALSNVLNHLSELEGIQRFYFFGPLVNDTKNTLLDPALARFLNASAEALEIFGFGISPRFRANGVFKETINAISNLQNLKQVQLSETSGQLREAFWYAVSYHPLYSQDFFPRLSRALEKSSVRIVRAFFPLEEISVLRGLNSRNIDVIEEDFVYYNDVYR